MHEKTFQLKDPVFFFFPSLPLLPAVRVVKRDHQVARMYTVQRKKVGLFLLQKPLCNHQSFCATHAFYLSEPGLLIKVATSKQPTWDGLQSSLSCLPGPGSPRLSSPAMRTPPWDLLPSPPRTSIFHMKF